MRKSGEKKSRAKSPCSDFFSKNGEVVLHHEPRRFGFFHIFFLIFQKKIRANSFSLFSHIFSHVLLLIVAVAVTSGGTGLDNRCFFDF